MSEATYNSDLVRGSIDSIILCVLLDSDNYGYQIIKEIYTRSGNSFELKEPTLYSSLRRLESQDAIASYWGEETQGGRRKYYRITELGKDMYSRHYLAWQSARDLIDRLITRDRG